MRVAMIGAGSIGFRVEIMMDLLAVPEFRNTEFSFMDIDPRVEMSTSLYRKMIADNDLPRLSPRQQTEGRLQGADYVLSFVRVGGLEAFAHDIEVPLRYGVDQRVGGHLGPRVIFYGLRTIPTTRGRCQGHGGDLPSGSTPPITRWR